MYIPVVFLVFGGGRPRHELAILHNIEIGSEPTGVHSIY